MKQKLYSFLWLSGVLLVFFVCLPQTKLQAAGNKSEITGKKNFDDGKKPARKERSFKNQNVVKIFPDVIKKTIHVVARSGNEKEIEFLVFDIDGNMVLNYKMKAGEKRAISHLKKGFYMYHVFSEDEYLTTGKIEFR
ncbi:MAG: T9SS type A sorting domain-containing protein [Chitinophagales bacterium]